MYIINTTYTVESSVEEEWLNWVKSEYFEAVKSSELVSEPKLFKVMIDETEGVTYSVQLKTTSEANVKAWLTGKNKEKVGQLRVKFGQKVLGFTTLLHEID